MAAPSLHSSAVRDRRRSHPQAGELISARSVCHSGRAAIAARAGIHNHRLWVWIPGSRASPAPRNDESEFSTSPEYAAKPALAAWLRPNHPPRRRDDRRGREYYLLKITPSRLAAQEE